MRWLLISTLVVLATAGCSGQTPGVGQAASSQLTPEVQQIRAAATTGDTAATAAKLAELRRTVADLRQRRELTDAGATEVLAAAAEVEAGTGAGGAPEETPPASSTTPRAGTSTTLASARTGSSDTQPTPRSDGKGKGKGGGKDGQGG